MKENNYGSYFEVLTVEEFAERMKFDDKYIYQLIQNDTLIAGRHYMRMGKQRGIRFPWSYELIMDLMNTFHPRKPEEPSIAQASRPKPSSIRKTKIDLNL